MKVLLRSALIVDPASAHNKTKKDIFVEHGVIKEIADVIAPSDDTMVIEKENLHVSPGWVDMHCYLRDPGLEHKEDLYSASEAASAGGFTTLVCMPVTEPAVDNKSLVEYIINKADTLVTSIYPAGTITAGNKGTDISEMYDMKLAGAVAFTEGKKSLKQSGTLSRALLYAKGINAPILHFPEDETIALDGKMNEGVNSTRLGLKGIPALAEELCVARDLFLAEYNDTSIHIQCVSSAGTVQLIRNAKKIGIKVTCEVTANHLLLDDSMLDSFDSNYKIKPPLRTKKDIEALIDGLKDGTIDAIVSDHTPHDPESKVKEFDLASFGIISLETAYGVLNTALSGKMTVEDIIRKLAINPRTICRLPMSRIGVDEIADMTLFDPLLKWTFSADDIRSKSRNTPYIGTTFTGKALGVVNKNQIEI
jgi:dihydroorotase